MPFQNNPLDIFYKTLNQILKNSAVTVDKRPVPIVVSLTSIPERMHLVHLCIESLLNQSLKPDYLNLWLPESEQVNSDTLPRKLRDQQERGLTIDFVRDIGSYTKLLYSLKRFRHAVIVTADDDTIYPSTWLEGLYTSHLLNKNSIICYRGTLITGIKDRGIDQYSQWPEYNSQQSNLSLFPTGKDGILYPPFSLHDEVFNEPVFREICPTGDDIWFKAMSLRKSTLCQKITMNHVDFPTIPGSQLRTLHQINNIGGQNEVQLRKVFEKYKLQDRLRASVIHEDLP